MLTYVLEKTWSLKGPCHSIFFLTIVCLSNAITNLQLLPTLCIQFLYVFVSNLVWETMIMTTTKRQKIVHLKISNLESNFWNSQFFWKMNEKRKILRGLRIIFFSVFLCFLEVFTIPEIAFEIYWPLEAWSAQPKKFF